MPNVHSQGTRWCLTKNNPTNEVKLAFAQVFNSDDVKYGIIGREVGEQGTPHLQCFIIFKRTKRFNAVLRLFPGSHLESARGTSEQNRAYCEKGGDFDEYGSFPDNQGKRSDLDEVLEWAEDFSNANGRGPTSPEVAVSQPRAYIKFPRVTRCLKLRAAAPKLREGEPNLWQQTLHDQLMEDADDRSVLFYVDPEGNSGKTWFQQWFLTKYPEKTQLLSVGKRDDLAYAVDETKSVFLFNIPRGSMEYFQYTICEQLKDRMIFSTKYQSSMKILSSVPHVVVFCNEEPDMSKMSQDRYILRTPRF